MWRSLISAGVVALVLTAPAGAHGQSPTVILYQQDHKDRAEALAKALRVDLAFCLPVTESAREVKGLTTLTVWGHGDQETFCNLDASQFAKLLQAWIEENPKLKTVEIFTCDARHKSKDNTFDAYSIRVDFEVRLRGLVVTIKALPVSKSGHNCSILAANADTATFCYITAKDQQTLNSTLNALQVEADKVRPKGDANQAASKLKQSSQYSLVGGSLKDVRTKLVVVKK
jgi:hypothetical protein